MTKTYEIKTVAGNRKLGTFEAETVEQALDLFAQAEGAESFSEAEASDPTLRSEIKVVEVKAASAADTLRDQLTVAARTAQQFGATVAQIDFIVSLSVKANNFDIMSGGRLTKADASHIIDSLR